jgi:HEAT repeat protein
MSQSEVPEKLLAHIKSLRHPDADVRERAVEHITEIKPQNAFELVLPMLSDPDPEVRGTAASSLADLQDERAIEPLINASRDDSDQDVREHALFSLGVFSHPAIRARLVDEVAQPKKSRRPRQIVARQLANYDHTDAVRALTELLEDDDVHVRNFAVDSLLEHNHERLRQTWERALHDDSPYVRDIARKALEKLSGEAG